MKSINKINLSLYLEKAKVEEISEELKKQGYIVNLEKQYGEYRYDIVAKKGKSILLFEIKTGSNLIGKSKVLSQMAAYTKALKNVKFELVIVNPPKEKEIEIENIENIIYAYIINEATPNKLDILSTHSRIEDISDVEIVNIKINGGEIKIKGNGLVGVTLQYGSDSDNKSEKAVEYIESFPFEYEYTLNSNLKIISCEKLTIDTSSFEKWL